MSSRPSTARNTGAGPPHTRPLEYQRDQHTSSRDANLDRPLPPTPSASLPNSYEIPTLRQKPPPTSPNGTPTKHGRSISHPFPSLFGGRRLDKRRQDDDFDSSDSGTPSKIDVARSKSGRANKTPLAAGIERQPQIGKCMTCDAVVRWPQELKVFRCTTCLTVNDLEPSEEQRPVDGILPQAPAKKPAAISLQRTKSIIDQCLSEYFERVMSLDDYGNRHGNEPQPMVTSHFTRPQLNFRKNSGPPIRPGPSLEGIDMTMVGGHARPPPQRSYSDRVQPMSGEDRGKNMTANEERITDASLAIFRPLENYIGSSFAGCTALNISFFSVQPPSESLDRSSSDSASKKQGHNTIVTPHLEIEDFVSELDAKILLLGDVAENGSWWTGSRTPRPTPTDRTREKSPEGWRGIVSAKSPRIHWLELTEWYQAIVNAGNDWQKRWQSIQPAGPGHRQTRWRAISPAVLQHEITESQLHLQRRLLKATEDLLKRPRRPLKNPEDCRFLLMLLANPLLYGPSRTLQRSASIPTPVPVPAASGNMPGANMRENPSQHTLTSPRRTGSLGHHSGIIKRILGLVASLPNDVHSFFVSWLSRFSDSHFQRLVDMVSSFVTYRLCRQQDRVVKESINPTAGLVPTFSDSGVRHVSELHAALEVRPSNSAKKKQDGKPKIGIYSEDWQIRAAARFMSLLFQANSGHLSRKRSLSVPREQRFQSAGLNAKYQAYSHGQIVPISSFYNSMLDYADLVADFEAWETTKSKFSFCQYPFFLSIGAKIQILEHDARRQMEVKAREAFFDSIISRKAVSQYLVLKVRRECLVEDSLKTVSEVIGSGGDDLKKGLRIDFIGEEGIDGGGLRKEWFLSLVREIFDPHHGLFVYDEDSQYCYFNPYCLESSEQFFLVGVLLGLAIYNSTILDVAFPPFIFKKLLASAPVTGEKLTSMPKVAASYTLEDLAEFRPVLAKGLRQLLEFQGDVQETFCREFVIEMDKYGEIVQIPLCVNGHKRSVTNSNRREFVDLYVRYLLETAVTRQYEPFKRGFFTVCGGNALSLFRPEEIELLVRGSDEPLDVASLRAVASYENWPKSAGPVEQQAQVVWFWECFERATPADQRKLLGFITGSDRIPAMGTTNLNIKLQLLRDNAAEEYGVETERFPIARTCFNTLALYRYGSKRALEDKLWTAVFESEGFGLK